MSTPQDIVAEAVNLLPVAEVAISLIAKVVQMAEDAKGASQEKHDSIMGRLKAAEDSLATAADSAHQALADELAKDK